MAYGQVKPTALENEEHDSAVIAKRVTEIPSNLQMRISYNGSNQEEYIGYAARGLASSDTGWILHKLTYTSSQLTLRQVAYDSWDNRATTAVYA